jgi:hypothetical protein
MKKQNVYERKMKTLSEVLFHFPPSEEKKGPISLPVSVWSAHQLSCGLLNYKHS